MPNKFIPRYQSIMKSISKWSDLNRKALRKLYINENPELKLNLVELSKQNHQQGTFIKLKTLKVSKHQISGYFESEEGKWLRDPSCSQRFDWIAHSTLQCLMIREWRRSVSSCQNYHAFFDKGQNKTKIW